MTHTYALLEVSEEAWEEIRKRLIEAGRRDVDKDGEIDMHGIALVKEEVDREELMRQFRGGHLEREDD